MNSRIQVQVTHLGETWSCESISEGAHRHRLACSALNPSPEQHGHTPAGAGKGGEASVLGNEVVSVQGYCQAACGDEAGGIKTLGPGGGHGGASVKPRKCLQRVT